jgi:hypothetical protein
MWITGLDNDLQSSQTQFYGTIRSQGADDYYIYAFDYYESVPEAFCLAQGAPASGCSPDGVPVLLGIYHWTNFGPRIVTSRGRALAVNWQGECCSFYNGSYLKSDLSLIFRPNQFFEITPRHTATFIDLPTGYVAIHILSASGGVNFTPDMQILVQAQYDNISRSLGFSLRYRWEYQPGNELFAAFGQSALIPGTTFEPQTTDVSVRLGQTFRF